jgi:hypothetical protein
VSLFLVYIQEFDEVKGKLGLTGIAYVKWRDETVSASSLYTCFSCGQSVNLKTRF